MLHLKWIKICFVALVYTCFSHCFSRPNHLQKSPDLCTKGLHHEAKASEKGRIDGIPGVGGEDAQAWPKPEW